MNYTRISLLYTMAGNLISLTWAEGDWMNIAKYTYTMFKEETEEKSKFNS